jgi:CO dehydrogenase maturation factor
MKIAIVGKGGSGKSTLSWLLTQRLLARARTVLAIDGDYNMDLAQNLGWQPDQPPPFISTAERDFYAFQSLGASDYYVDLPTRTDLRSFSLTPLDNFTEKYTSELSPALRLMIAGPTNPNILYGHRCSHAYVSSLKYYLPLLHLSPNEDVVVDGVAGTDMVAYGMYLGVDAMVCVVEPTRNSIGVYHQILGIADEFDIPLYHVWSKLDGAVPHDVQGVSEPAIGAIPLDMALVRADLPHLGPATLQAADAILDKLAATSFAPQAPWQRHQRWHEGYKKQLDDAKKDPMNFVATT